MRPVSNSRNPAYRSKCAHAGEYSAGLDYAMLAFKNLGLIPDARLIRAVLDSPWCEEDSYADVIGHELLAKAETSIAS